MKREKKTAGKSNNTTWGDKSEDIGERLKKFLDIIKLYR